MTTFRVVVPAYKAGPWIGRCIKSIRRQQHQDFTCLVIDDQSPDDTFQRAVKAAGGDERFTIMRAPERRMAMGNWVAGIPAAAQDEEDVIVNVDGDDWLPHDRVLQVLDDVYADSQVWITYGSHRRWKNKINHWLRLTVRRGIAAPYPQAVLTDRSFREHEFLASHLRTFKTFLWNAIHHEDLCDTDGEHFQLACDAAFMYPMLEMAGGEHLRYLDEILYVYNNSNPLNDHKAAAQAQRETADRIRNKPRYPLLMR